MRAFVFPGQGSQFVGMGKDLFEQYPEARSIFEQADAALGFPSPVFVSRVPRMNSNKPLSPNRPF